MTRPLFGFLRLLSLALLVTSVAAPTLALAPAAAEPVPVAATTAAPAPASAAARAGAAVRPPVNPCRTFTAKSVRALFGVSPRARLRYRLHSYGTGARLERFCTVVYRGHLLQVVTQNFPSPFGGRIKCYRKPVLGRIGKVCVSTAKRQRASWAVFRKKGTYYYDGVNMTLGRNGARLRAFALAQYRRQ